MSSTMDQWYYRTSNIERGPLTLEELGFLKNRGKLTTRDLVRKGKNGTWIRAGSVNTLFPSEIVTRSKMSLAALMAASGDSAATAPGNPAEPVATGAELDMGLESEQPELSDHSTPLSPPPMADDRRRRIAIGTSIGAGTVLLILLLLLLLFWPDGGAGGRGGGTIAGTGIGDQQGDGGGKGEGSNIGDSSLDGAGHDSSKDSSSSDSTGEDEPIEEVEVSDAPPQQSSSGKKEEPPQEEPEEPSLLTVQRLPSGNSKKGTGGGGGSGGSLGNFNERIDREGAKTGDVQITLIWNNRNDLDLHVLCPSGERISFNNKRSSDGGVLDVDMNVRGDSTKPVENVYWPTGGAPRGRFQIYVHHFANKGSRDPTRFSVRIKVDGKNWQFKGSVRNGQPPKMIHSFTR